METKNNIVIPASAEAIQAAAKFMADHLLADPNINREFARQVADALNALPAEEER